MYVIFIHALWTPETQIYCTTKPTITTLFSMNNTRKSRLHNFPKQGQDIWNFPCTHTHTNSYIHVSVIYIFKTLFAFIMMRNMNPNVIICYSECIWSFFCVTCLTLNSLSFTNAKWYIRLSFEFVQWEKNQLIFLKKTKNDIYSIIH